MNFTHEGKENNCHLFWMLSLIIRDRHDFSTNFYRNKNSQAEIPTLKAYHLSDARIILSRLRLSRVSRLFFISNGLTGGPRGEFSRDARIEKRELEQVIRR